MTNNFQHIQDRLTQGGIVILDGATGTELERLGAPMHTDIWCAEALGSHPALVLQVHENYLRAGADIITANTYASGRHSLERAGLGNKFEEWNIKAVTLAKEARAKFVAEQPEKPIVVAGSVAPFNAWRLTDMDYIAASFQEQAELLAEHQVDLLILETLGTTVPKIKLALDAALSTGLPIWLSMSCMVDRTSDEVFLGVEESQEQADFRTAHQPFGEAIQELMGSYDLPSGSALLMMHSDLKATHAAVQVMKENYQGTLGVYPNAGYWLRPEWAFVDSVTPEAYVGEAQQWVAEGVQIVGGCCGIGPEHIRALYEEFSE
ncbi:MAG: homocysteine S-methyltransferase family protein [Chloroflexota bacterium]